MCLHWDTLYVVLEAPMTVVALPGEEEENWPWRMLPLFPSWGGGGRAKEEEKKLPLCVVCVCVSVMVSLAWMDRQVYREWGGGSRGLQQVVGLFLLVILLIKISNNDKRLGYIFFLPPPSFFCGSFNEFLVLLSLGFFLSCFLPSCSAAWKSRPQFPPRPDLPLPTPIPVWYFKYTSVVPLKYRCGTSWNTSVVPL